MEIYSNKIGAGLKSTGIYKFVSSIARYQWSEPTNHTPMEYPKSYANESARL
jgi:hypothetical protein